ncbi:hypothetical protein [Castellaniella sp. GW247-6E4]|uniref:hypothetical protein n=1 Tax=Castellaniella sp. GW247-6E4 TaxID=3140380 RepID=UPI003314AF46
MPASLLSGLSIDALVIRMVATAFVVIAVTWSVGAFGPRIGGALAGLPIVLGPGFYFLGAQASAPFIAQAATYALLSLCATQLFLLAYLAAARRARPLAALAGALTVWLLSAAMLRLLPAEVWLAATLFALATWACWSIGARFLSPVPTAKGKVGGTGLLLLRGLLAGVLVAAVTTLNQRLGSAGSGLLLAFPIGYTVIAVTIHQRIGSASVIATLRSALLGTVSLAGFCATLALAITLGPWQAALGIALAASVAITLWLVQAAARKSRASPAGDAFEVKKRDTHAGIP